MRQMRAAYRNGLRARRGPLDQHDECDRCVGLVFRHTTTGQLRRVYECRNGCVFFEQFDSVGRIEKTFAHTYSSALAWLRNAKAVHTNF